MNSIIDVILPFCQLKMFEVCIFLLDDEACAILDLTESQIIGCK